METTELNSEKMKVLKEIADSNVILSGLQAEIHKLETDKEAFFQLRQDQLSSRLAEFMRDSKIMVDDTEKNYTHVHNFYEELKKFAELVNEQRDEVEAMLVDLNNKSVDFENHILRETARMSELQTRINQDYRAIEQEQNFIRGQREAMTKEKAVFAAKQKELNSALESLKKK